MEDILERQLILLQYIDTLLSSAFGDQFYVSQVSVKVVGRARATIYVFDIDVLGVSARVQIPDMCSVEYVKATASRVVKAAFEHAVKDVPLPKNWEQ